MPFVPLTPEEEKAYAKYNDPCRDPQHSPPPMYCPLTVMKWQCPACGEERLLLPANVTMR